MTAGTLFVILPAYNEEKALTRLIPDLDKTLKTFGQPFRILLVDDGSRDGTAAVVASFSGRIPLEFLRHPRNLGYGATLKTGFIWVIKNGRPEDIAVSLDSDNTHPPEVIPELIEKLNAGCDAVTASYTRAGGRAVGVPLLRQVFSRVANALLRLRFRFPGVRTYSNGFRAYRVSALQKAYEVWKEGLVVETDFAGGTELFIKVVGQGARVGEIPFTLHYENRGSNSKINIPRTILGYLKLLRL